MDLQLQMARTYDYIKSISIERGVSSPPSVPHIYLTRCTRGEGENASYMSKSCNAAGHQSEIQYEITADSAMRLWQQGQHGQQLRGVYRGGTEGGTECSSVVLVLVERTQSRIFIKIESSMSRGQHRRRRRRRRLRQTVSSMRKDSSRQDKERQETRRRLKAEPSCATTHRTSEPFHTSIRAQPQRQFS